MSKVQQCRDNLISHQMEGWEFPGGANGKEICLAVPEMWETRVWSLSWEDPLEKEMASHASILAWKVPWTEELGGL